MLIYIEVDRDVEKPEGGSPTQRLPSLSGGDNETDRGSKREEWGGDPHGKNMSDLRHNQQMSMRCSHSISCCFVMLGSKYIAKIRCCSRLPVCLTASKIP